MPHNGVTHSSLTVSKVKSVVAQHILLSVETPRPQDSAQVAHPPVLQGLQVLQASTHVQYSDLYPVPACMIIVSMTGDFCIAACMIFVTMPASATLHYIPSIYHVLYDYCQHNSSSLIQYPSTYTIPMLVSSAVKRIKPTCPYLPACMHDFCQHALIQTQI